MTGWYDRLGAIECVLLVPRTRVEPSAGAFAAMSEPTPPPAPGRFSMITGWPSTDAMPGWIMRVIRSEMPPVS